MRLGDWLEVVVLGTWEEEDALPTAGNILLTWGGEVGIIFSVIQKVLTSTVGPKRTLFSAGSASMDICVGDRKGINSEGWMHSNFDFSFSGFEFQGQLNRAPLFGRRRWSYNLLHFQGIREVETVLGEGSFCTLWIKAPSVPPELIINGGWCLSEALQTLVFTLPAPFNLRQTVSSGPQLLGSQAPHSLGSSDFFFY